MEYAASGRAVCRGCEIKILKDEVRIKKVDYTTEVGMKYGGQALWHHAECFAKVGLTFVVDGSSVMILVTFLAAVGAGLFREGRGTARVS